MAPLTFVILVGCVVYNYAAHCTSFYDSNGSCNVSWADTESQSVFQRAVIEQNLLVFMHISLEGSEMAINGSSQAFDASRWVRTRDGKANGLLFLKNHFEVLSLYSLSFGVEHLDIPLRDQPKGCFFKWRNYSDVEGDLCRLILTDFNFQIGIQKGSSWYDEEKVCNFRFARETGKPEYICCQFDDEGNLIYSVLDADLWVNVSVICIRILTVIFALYSPKIIPVYFYKSAYGEELFEYKLPNKLQIGILKTHDTLQTQDSIVIDSVALEKMPELGKYVQTMPFEEEKLITLDKVHIIVPKRRLIPEDDVPIGILYSLYESFVQCEVRHRDAFALCCNGNIFPFTVCDFGTKWHDILKIIMHVVLIGIFFVPYIVRLVFYYYIDKPYIDYLRETAKNRKWIDNVIYAGCFTSYLGPDHPFLITIYVVLGFGIIIMALSMCAGRNITENLISVLRNCLRDMNDDSRVTKTVNWTVKVLLSPFTFLGVVGVLVVPLYWVVVIPLVGIFLICHAFPAIYLLIRLISNFFLPYVFDVDITPGTHINVGIKNAARRIKSQKSICKWLHIKEFKEIVKGTFMYNSTEKFNGSSTYKCLQGFFTIFCAFIVLSILFLALDVILFLLEIMVYTAIGIILNARYVFRFVILALALLFYARDCINSVRKKYLAFNKIILPAVRDSSEGVLDVANQDENDQQNTAFILNVPNKKAKSPSLVLINDKLNWKLHQVIVFLDKHDTPYITESFFFKTCEMPYEKCPGLFLENFNKALLEIFMVFLFLLFVALVILAFGKSFEVSPTNQTLATFAGSFLPLLLKHFFFKDHSNFSIDTSKIKFTTCLNETIASYIQEWPIADLVPFDIEEKDDNDTDTLQTKRNTDSAKEDGTGVTECNDGDVGDKLKSSTGQVHTFDSKDDKLAKNDDTACVTDDDVSEVIKLTTKLIIVCGSDSDEVVAVSNKPSATDDVVMNMNNI